MESPLTLSSTFKTLCSRYGWSYSIFWRFHHRNPMFLTLGDAYEDQMGGFNDDMLLQVHMLGQGIVGEAALTGKDQWIHSEPHCPDENAMGPPSYQDAQTVVAIPLESHGVVQFGSTRKIPESMEFLDLTKKLFHEIISLKQANASTSLHCRHYDSDECFDSLFSDGLSTCGNQVLRPSNTSTDLPGGICQPTNVSLSPPSVSKMHYETMEPELVLSDMLSLDQLFPSETTPTSPFVFPPFPATPITYNEANLNFQEDSPFASTDNIEELLNVENSPQFNSGQLVDCQPPNLVKSELPEISCSLLDFQHEAKPVNWPSAHFESCLEYDVSQWPGPPPDSIAHDLAPLPKNEHSPFSAIMTNSILNKGDAHSPVNHQAHSLQRNGTKTPVSCLVQGLEVGQGTTLDLQNCPPTVSSCISGISELDAICMSRPRKGLFSELGIEQLLSGSVSNSGPVGRSSCDDPNSTSKRRKTRCSPIRGSRIQSELRSCVTEKISSFQHPREVVKWANQVLQKDFMLKPQAGLRIEDRFSINAESTNMTLAKSSQESTKPIKKRAKPGESTRPRPKDRQLFQERLGELRKMIPNTGKCSIDALLESTIKHMLFLQNVTNYAEKLQQIADRKEKGTILKNNANGVTWAFELCDQAMICPIKVEDVGVPGQMLIEMLCDDGGSFLEMADTIHSFGLCILNGSMVYRSNKTWAHFIVEVEATRSVTRVDVFWSLAQHLQQSTSSVTDSVNELPIDGASGAKSYSLHQKNLAEAITLKITQ